MTAFRTLLFLLTVASLAIMTSCSSGPPDPNPNQTTIESAELFNPYPPGSYAHFTYRPYPGTMKTWKNSALLNNSTPLNTKIQINLRTQRGILLVNDQIAMDYRVSSGSSDHKTPSGSYRIIEKTRSRESNTYGKIKDSEGKVINSNADIRTDTVPEGGSFVGASMPYWMRLTWDGLGMHQGKVNRRYASHGCIRTHYSAVPIVFAKTDIGTRVELID